MGYKTQTELPQISQLENKQWYHQRFDGCPYFLHLIAEAEIITDRDIKDNMHFSVHTCFFEDGKADWYILQDDIERISRLLQEYMAEDSLYLNALLSRWKNKEENFNDFVDSFDRIQLSEYSDAKLMELHDTYVELALARNSSSSIIDGFALGTDRLLESKLRAVYEGNKSQLDMSFTEFFSIVTAPIYTSFLAAADISLLGYAIQVETGYIDIDTAANDYQKEYFWIRNNYVESITLSYGEIAKEIQTLIAKGDVKHTKEELETFATNNTHEKEHLLKKVSLPEDVAHLLTITEEFTRWQDERKQSTFLSTYVGTELLKEIAKRVYVPLPFLQYMSPREVSKIMESEPTMSQLRERKRASVAYWDGNSHMVTHDTTSIKKVRDIIGTDDITDVKDFRGMTACRGKTIGTVKVVKTVKEIDKVEEGDILVAVMTRPDYVPAMKRAAAIVTDEGGITCHAAIVSRELGIPCVIGTKIATQVLSDGETVSVNADHSVIIKQ